MLSRQVIRHGSTELQKSLYSKSLANLPGQTLFFLAALQCQYLIGRNYDSDYSLVMIPFIERAEIESVALHLIVGCLACYPIVC